MNTLNQILNNSVNDYNAVDIIMEEENNIKVLNEIEL